MFQELADLARPVLNFPYVRRTRRNHGLEHATIHVLSDQHYRLSGRSDGSGFVLLGEVPTQAVETAAREALHRMQNGEHHLAVHPNCGTNLLTTGFLASMVGLIGMAGSSRRDTFNRLPMVMLAMMIAILYSQPVGMSLQRYFTTEGNPGDLEIVGITRGKFRVPLGGTVAVHRVTTRGG
jgi:uncharacterized protein DUF6391